MQVFTNQRELENEAKRLQALSSRYSKQTTQWLAMIDGFNTALKELGDVQSWARSIENDMRTIAQALEYVHQGALRHPPDDAVPSTDFMFSIQQEPLISCILAVHSTTRPLPKSVFCFISASPLCQYNKRTTLLSELTNAPLQSVARLLWRDRRQSQLYCPLRL